MTNKHKGFTLTEILIVVTIIIVLGIAILVGINPMSQIFKGYDARRKADLSEIKIALENYYADHDCYPAFPIINGKPGYVCGSDFLKPYLPIMPCDPNTNEPYSIYLTPSTSSCPQNFAIYAQIYSFFDKQANNIAYCPDTFAVFSPGIGNLDLIYGCSEQEMCQTYYGCVNGACILIAKDSVPACTPNYCDDPACSPVDLGGGNFLNCTTTFPDTGEYVRQCNPI